MAQRTDRHQEFRPELGRCHGLVSGGPAGHHSRRCEESVPLSTNVRRSVKSISRISDGLADFVHSYMVMGMSAETFWGGKDGAAQFEQFMGEISGGLKVSTGAQAAQAALNSYGAKKIGIITPYQAVGDQQVVDFFTQVSGNLQSNDTGAVH